MYLFFTKINLRISICLIVLAIMTVSCGLLPSESTTSEITDDLYMSSLMSESEMIQSKNNLGTDDLVDQSRMLIYSVDMTISVQDPIYSMNRVSRLSSDYGGYVVNTNIYYGDPEVGFRNNLNSMVPEAYVSIRVVSDLLDEAILSIEDMGVVRSLTRSGRDITKEYTDVDSRLRNMLAAEQQLLELMEKADTTESTMDVFREITRVREQIELLNGEKIYYQQSSELAFIGVRFVSDPEKQPVKILGWDVFSTFKSAVEALFIGLQWFGDMLIYFVITILPIGIIVSLPLYFAGRFMVNILRSKK